MGVAIGKEACPRCQENGHDNHGDNLVKYEDGSSHCFACGYTVMSQEEKERRGIETFNFEKEYKDMSKEPLAKEEISRIKSSTITQGGGLRGISDETYSVYYVRHKVDENNIPTAQLYPIFENSSLAGFKVRELPKKFSVIGKMGNESDLFGQYRFRNSNSKRILITAGEVDCMSAYEMLNARNDKGYEPIPVVSAVVGETGSYKQIKNHFEWLDRFEHIVVCYDSDKAGEEAVANVAKVIPKEKLLVMSLPLKDANEMLVNNRDKQFVSAFFNAKPYVPAGITGSSSLHDSMLESASLKKIPLPPFMHRLQKCLSGGIALGHIVNIAGASGQGKSTIVDELVYHWIFNSPYKVGIVPMEASQGIYALNILSRHVGRKISAIESDEEKLAFLNSDAVVEKEKHLFFTETGEDRFYIVDNRDASVDALKKLVERMIVECECKVIVLDPLSDILDNLTTEEQAVFMGWQKRMLLSHGVTFVNVCHTRKTSQGEKAGSQGGNLSEESIHGSSSVYKSGSVNLILGRNKEAEDEIERNTTYLKLSKNRWAGVTTPVAGKYYYDLEHHTLYDFDDFFSGRNLDNVSF